MFVVLASFLACFSNTPSSGDSSGDDPTDPSQPWSESDTGTNEDSEPDTGDTDTEHTGEDTAQPPLVEVDVLVVGSGPAGLSAAWRARQAGAQVVILERDDLAGGSGIFASNFFAVGTPQQAEAGVQDSPEIAGSEWAEFTGGGSSSDPWVQRLLHESDEILSWLINELGAEFLGLELDVGAGSIKRLHSLSYGDKHPLHTLVSELEDDIWLHHEAQGLVMQDAAVIGAEVTDLRNGEAFWIAAKETIIATGGFARNASAFMEDREDTQGLLVLYEAHRITEGYGLPLLRDAGAALQNKGNYGLYVHSVQDPRAGMDREAIWLPKIRESLIVDRTGRRVGDETLTQAFQLQHLLLKAPDQRLFALIPPESWATQQFVIPGYNLNGPEDPNALTAQQMIDQGAVQVHMQLAETADTWGMPPAALEATVAAYNAAAATGLDSHYGKNPDTLFSFEEGPFYSVELHLGAAKAFGGAELDPDGRVLDENGEVIEGLWAAGEAAGMLGTEAVSEGFSGSVTACYLTGQVAGQNAAAEALSSQ